jgi:hypothetical protein
VAAPEDPRGWMHALPDVAAIVAGAVAFVIRTSNSDGPRPWRVVLADALGTLALGYALYYGALAALDDGRLAVPVAVLSAAMGWEWVRRHFGAWADKRGAK